MKEKEIIVSWGETLDLPPSYGTIKPTLSIKGVLEEGDDPEQCTAHLLQTLHQRYEAQVRYMAQARAIRDRNIGKESLPILLKMAGYQ